MVFDPDQPEIHAKNVNNEAKYLNTCLLILSDDVDHNHMITLFMKFRS